MLDALWQDSRYAIRALRNDPGFAAITALSLALAIGANTAIFSLIDALMLKTLPVSHPEQLVQVTAGGGGGEYFSNPVWEQIRDRQDAFSGILAYCRWAFDLAPGGEARQVDGAYVSGRYFETLGVPAVLGRTLRPDDDYRGCAGRAVLTHGFWQREYGGPTDIIGRSISVDRHPFEIVGVSAPGFTGTEVGASLDVMVPLCAEKILHGDSTLLDADPSGRWLRILGRPRPGMPASQISAQLRALAPEVFRATVRPKWPAADREKWLRLPLMAQDAATGLSYLRENYRQALLILMAITGIVLLIGCANVSSLLLARGAARHREIAIRVALGSGRGRLLRQLLTESLLLSFLGTGLGVLLAALGTRVLVRFLNVSLDLTPDPRVIGFPAGLALLTGLLFGLAPAWRSARADPMAAMKAGARGVVQGSGAGSRKMLAVGQVALSMVLVAGASLLLSTFWRLVRLDPGFDPGRILVASLDLRGSGYTAARRDALFRQALERIRATPGVQSASLSDFTPMFLGMRVHDLTIDGGGPEREAPRVFFNAVSEGYFSTMGTGLVAGRDFDVHDTPASPAVAIVNQTMARRFFGETSPVGRRFRIRTGDTMGEPVQIIAVVKDAKYTNLRQEIPPTAYTVWSQSHFPFPNIEIRATTGAPRTLVKGVTNAVASIDAGTSIKFTALADEMADTLKRERLLATLASFFGCLALLLAIIGLYGVMSYNVTRRRKEIGVRMALGAEEHRILRMVLREVAVVIGAGIAVGLGFTLAATRLVASLLYGVRPNDPLTLLLAVAVLIVTLAAAGYGPARRASRLDPMVTLREE